MKHKKKQVITKFDLWPPPVIKDEGKKEIKKAKNKSYIDQSKEVHFESQEIFDPEESKENDEFSKEEEK